MSSSLDEKRPHSPASLPEDAVPKLDKAIEEEIHAEEDAHLGVKAVEAAEKVYGRYSKWFLFVGYVPAALPAPAHRTLTHRGVRDARTESVSRRTSTPWTARRRTTTCRSPPPRTTGTVLSPLSRSHSLSLVRPPAVV